MTEIIKSNRRSFLTGLGAIIAAPAIIKVSAIMPVKVIDKIDYERFMRKFLLNSSYGSFYNPLLDAWYYGEQWTKLEQDKLILKGKVIPINEIYKA